MGPITQAAAGFQAEATVEVFFLAAVDIQLIAHNQATAAVFWQVVVHALLVFTLGVFSQQRDQRVFKVVVNCQQLFGAVGRAVAQFDALFKVVRPCITFGDREGAAVVVGKVNKC